MAAHPHVGDVHRIQIDVKDDDAAVVALTGPVTMRLTAPSGASHDVTATLVSSGTTGVCYYDATTATLDESGEWSAQLCDTAGPWRTSIVAFTVDPNLPEP